MNYLPNGTIFDAKLKSGSYAWKSILRAQRVISLGAVWRIGDGCTALIFKDKWILGLEGGRVVSPISILPDNAMVDQLIDGGSKWWNYSLIDYIYYLLKTRKIKAISLCSTAQADSFLWPNTGNEMHSVKSGYNLL